MTIDLNFAHAAIEGVCLGAIGIQREMDEGDLTRAVDGASTDVIAATRMRALKRKTDPDDGIAPVFDIAIASGAEHEATPMSARGSYALIDHLVVILISFAVPAESQIDKLSAARMQVSNVCEQLRQALGYPGNLANDGTSGPGPNLTGIISGKLNNVAWEIDREDWSARLIRARVSGTMIIQQTQEVAT